MAEITTKRFIVCPGCGKYHHPVEHLFDGTERTFWSWNCGTEDCLTEISGAVHPDGTIDVKSEIKEKRQRGFALLKLRDLYFVREEKFVRIAPERADYFYHSHQCPTNLLHDVVKMYGPDGEHDPHGMIRYVAGIDDTPETRAVLETNPTLRQVMELFVTDGDPIPTDWPEADGGLLPMIAAWRRDEVKKS